MYMRAVIYRIVYVGIVSIGILLSASLRQSPVLAAPVAAVGHASTAVAAPAPIVTLATIHVHPTAVLVQARTRLAARTAAMHEGYPESAAADDHAAEATLTLRLDMPYYSFGKMLPRVGKGINQ